MARAVRTVRRRTAASDSYPAISKIAENKANPGFGLGPSFMDVGGVNERVQQLESSVTLDGGFDGTRVVPPLDTVLLPPSFTLLGEPRDQACCPLALRECPFRRTLISQARMTTQRAPIITVVINRTQRRSFQIS